MSQEGKKRERQRMGEGGREKGGTSTVAGVAFVDERGVWAMSADEYDETAQKKYANRQENWTTNGAIRELREYANTMNLTRMRGDSERRGDGGGQSSLLAAFMSIKNWRRHICRIYTHNQTHSQSFSLALSLSPSLSPSPCALSLSAACQQRLKAKQAVRPKDINWQ